MKVSIVMCAYNVAPYIDRAIQSVLHQTYTDWELIISDDRSTDETIAIVEKYLSDSRIKLYRHEKNVGYVANKNRAFSYATGELLTQLDADDTSTPDRIALQVAVFENNPHIKICGSNYTIIDTEDRILESKSYNKDFLVTELALEYPFWYPGLMFRTELITEFGNFSEYFNGIYGDDHFWTMRVNTRYPIYFIKKALYGYRINPHSLTNVLDKPRKLIAQDIIKELYRQLKETKTDWLSEGNETGMKAFEDSLYQNKALMAERYRVWAAKAIDKKNWHQAWSLLKSCLKTGKAGGMGYRTLFYYFKHRYLRTN
ncbi:MAG TPA: glycosyltransferase family 2 protein [Flavipsychrobacter sp.]